MFDNLVAGLKKRHTTLVFTEGADPRILSAAARLKREGVAEPLLIGSPEEVRDTAKGIGAELADIAVNFIPMLAVAAVTLPLAGWLFRSRS